jgi:N-acetylglucosamine-1-phosphodiester alpha-N-acetylglucosaminidase
LIQKLRFSKIIKRENLHLGATFQIYQLLEEQDNHFRKLYGKKGIMLMKDMILCIILLFLVVSTTAEIYYYNAPPASEDPELVYKKMDLSTERQRNIKALLTTVGSPVNFLHVITSGHEEGCTENTPTSKIAADAGCMYAVNGGPFDMDNGDCTGNIVSNGTVFLTDDNSEFASIALTTDNRWIFGKFGPDEIKSEGIIEAISGFKGPLLVENGEAVPSSSTLVAQRQAVGVDPSGKLMFLTIDGTETPPRGMNITELGQTFAELGAVAAVNLDGGGSTTTWSSEDGGMYVNRPTCMDVIVPQCERPVANIICVMPPV